MLDVTLIQSLARVVGEDNVLTGDEDLERYSTDALTPSRAFRAAPSLERTADAVVRPRSVREVSEVVKWASAHGLPIVPYGGGTGVMGAALPVRGGIVIDLKGLNTILDISPANRAVQVESGVVLKDLDTALEGHGMMLGHDPWSLPIATVGGAISTNGVGYRAAKYGPMGRQVLGLEVVLPNGEVLTTRSVPKYSSGPDLNHLFIGSEGVFGVITKATLRTFRQPEQRSFATIGFASFDHGFSAVTELFGLGLHPALVDLAEEDGQGVRLFMMYEGYEEDVAAQHQRSLKVCSGYGGSDRGASETVDYWNVRHRSGENYLKEMLDQPRSVRWRRRGQGFEYLHLALPVTAVLDYRRRCDEILSAQGINVVEYSIWTQPELFSLLLVPSEMAPSGGQLDGMGSGSLDGMGDVVDELLVLAQDMGGAMEYCHGVGVKLAHLLPREMGVGFEVARAIKRALDPNNIMNPGKLL